MEEVYIIKVNPPEPLIEDHLTSSDKKKKSCFFVNNHLKKKSNNLEINDQDDTQKHSKKTKIKTHFVYKSKKISDLGRDLIKEISSNLRMKKRTERCFEQNKYFVKLFSMKKNINFQSSIINYPEEINQLDIRKLSQSHNTNDKKDYQINQNNIIKEKVMKNSLVPLKLVKSSPRNLRKLKTINNLTESESDHNDEEEEEIIHSKPSSLMIDHEKCFRIIWDYLIFLMIIYTLFMSPIHLCFYEDNKTFILMEILIEFFFIIDFFLNFLTSYRDEEENIITNFVKILENYIFSIFMCDILSSCPFGFIDYIQGYKDSKKYLKWFNILRVAKLFNTQTTGRLINSIVLNNNLCLNRVFKFSFIFFMSTHITSCFFIFLANFRNTDINWIIINDLQNTDNLTVYIASLYYNIVTIYTVGYGDIVPVNMREKFYVIVLMLIGSLMFSYAISSLSTMFSMTNLKFNEFKRKLYVLNSIHDEFCLDFSLYTKLKHNIFLDFIKNNNDKYELLESLPSNIRNDLTMVMYKSQMKQHKFFKNKCHNFILYVLPLLKNHSVIKGDILISVGEIIEEMYLVLDGVLSIHLGMLFHNLEIGLVAKNYHFGDLLMQLNEQCPYELKCKTKTSEILVLKKSDFLKVKNCFVNDVLDILDHSFKNFEVLDKRRQVFIRLLKYCNSLDIVKKRMRQLNVFLMDKGFKNWFEHDIDFEEANDFLVRNQISSIKLLLDSLGKRTSNQQSSDYLKFSNVIKMKSGARRSLQKLDILSYSKLLNNQNCEKTKNFIKDSHVNKTERGAKEKFDLRIRKSRFENISLDIQLKNNTSISNRQSTEIAKEQFSTYSHCSNPKMTLINGNNLNIQNDNFQTGIRKSKIIEKELIDPDKINVKEVSADFESQGIENKEINTKVCKKSKTTVKNRQKKKNYLKFYNKIIKNFDSSIDKEILNRESNLNSNTLNLINNIKNLKNLDCTTSKKNSVLKSPKHSKFYKSAKRSTFKSNNDQVYTKNSFNGGVFIIEKTVDIHLTPQNKRFENLTVEVVSLLTYNLPIKSLSKSLSDKLKIKDVGNLNKILYKTSINLSLDHKNKSNKLKNLQIIDTSNRDTEESKRNLIGKREKYPELDLNYNKKTLIPIEEYQKCHSINLNNLKKLQSILDKLDNFKGSYLNRPSNDEMYKVD